MNRILLLAVILVSMDACIAFHPAFQPKSTKTMTKAVTVDQVSTIKKRRQPWGVDKDHPEEYWFDNRIHTIGNTGFWGAVHAAIAPASTKLIDYKAYDNVDIRKKLAQQLAKMVKNSQPHVVDLCCGAGFSTRALRAAFPEARIVGVDTSKEMLSMAQFITEHVEQAEPISGRSRLHRMSAYVKELRSKGIKQVEYLLGNAEKTELPSKKFDLVTVMYAFHEAPKQGRDKMVREARRLLSPGGTLAVIDISTDYTPSKAMLSGEPYVQEYQQNIHRQLKGFSGFSTPTYQDVIPNHLGMWTLKRSAVA